MTSDSFGSFIVGSMEHVAEIEFPASNISIYQEDTVGNGADDLLQYSEPWGGPQNKGTKSDLEGDPLMTSLGEHPEPPTNLVPEHNAPVNTTNNFGSGGSRDPSVGEGESGPIVSTVPEDRGATPESIGYPNDARGDADSMRFTDRVNVQASSHEGAVQKAIALAKSKGFVTSPEQTRLAFTDDLFGFEKLSSDSLVHKSSRELWTIKMGDAGETFIEKQFDDQGAPVRV